MTERVRERDATNVLIDNGRPDLEDLAIDDIDIVPVIEMLPRLTREQGTMLDNKTLQDGMAKANYFKALLWLG